MKKLLLFLSGVIVGYLLVNLRDILSKPAMPDCVDGMWDYEYPELDTYPHAWDGDYLEYRPETFMEAYADTQQQKHQ